MNTVRWLLLIPIVSCALCVFVASYVSISGIHQLPVFAPTETVAWHEAEISSTAPDVLTRHAESLWELYNEAGEVAIGYGKALSAAITVLIILSAATLLFCAAAFYKAKESEQASPANRHPFGTSGMAPADPATRAGALPEASGDS